MGKIEEIERIQRRIDQLEKDVQQARGAIQAHLQELKESYGCTSIEEARSLLEAKRKQKATEQKKFDRLFEKFMRKWGHLFR